MRINKILILSLCLLSVFACRKDPQTETKDYLDGDIRLVFPAYVEPGFSKDFCLDSLMKASRADGSKEIGYYYRGATETKNDTLVLGNGQMIKDKFTITAPKEIGASSFLFAAFCPDKYYSTTTSIKFNVVKPGFDGNGSLTNFEIKENELSFTDSRDGKVYYYTTIGSLDWMRTNLAWAGAGTAFENSTIMDDIFGRFYTQEEALSACPEGWRVPSENDWTQMAQTIKPELKQGFDFQGIAGEMMGNLQFNGEKMWEYWKEVYITDNTRLSLIPTGYALKEDNFKFQGTNQYSVLWTSDQDGDAGLIRYIYEKKDIVFTGKVSKSDFACSVRCVR